jgi:hypothetical protein
VNKARCSGGISLQIKQPNKSRLLVGTQKGHLQNGRLLWPLLQGCNCSPVIAARISHPHSIPHGFGKLASIQRGILFKTKKTSAACDGDNRNKNVIRNKMWREAPQLLFRTYGAGASLLAHMENILIAWHPIGHIWRIFSVTGILLVRIFAELTGELPCPNRRTRPYVHTPANLCATGPRQRKPISANPSGSSACNVPSAHSRVMSNPC